MKSIKNVTTKDLQLIKAIRQEEQNQQKSGGKPFWKGLMSGVIASSLVLGTGVSLGLGGTTPIWGNSTQIVGAQNNDSQALTDFETAITGAVKVAADAVVSIGNYQQATTPQGFGFNEYQQDSTIGEESDLQLAGEGSGVIYKIDGNTAYIVTNNHVVEGQEKLTVKMSDGTEVDGELVGTDEITDLAVIKIDAKAAKATTAIKFADSDSIEVGSLAIAIGSPLGAKYSNSVTQGIVSAAAREVSVDTDGDNVYDTKTRLIQTDAAINPGNSGGALINKQGQLIGINSNKFSGVEVEGMGFAIPSNEVQTIIGQLEKDGTIVRPVLGIQSVNVSNVSEAKRQEILGLSKDQTSGVAVATVMANSSAEKAGIQQYDVITQVDDTTIEDYTDLRQALYAHKTGDKVKVTLLRAGKETTVEVTLEAPSQSSDLLNE